MITLTKNKILYTNGYNPECDEYVKKEVPYLHPYLEDSVELSDDFTLGDLFRILENELAFMEAIFGSALGHFPLQSYIDDMKKFVEDEGDKLEYLRIQRFAERWEHSGEIDIVIDFSGISFVEDVNYAIEFSPLYTLRDLPIRLSNEFTISEMKCPSKIVGFFIRLRNRIHKPQVGWINEFTYVYVKGTTCFSVYELISTVLGELSFVGTPEMRDEKIVDIVEDIAAYREDQSDNEQ